VRRRVSRRLTRLQTMYNVLKNSQKLCLLLAQSRSNLPRSFEGFSRNSRRNFIQIRQRVNNVSTDPPPPPIANIARFRQRLNVAESGQILQWGSMRKFFICCRIQLKFRLRVRLNRHMIEVSLSLIERDITFFCF